MSFTNAACWQRCHQRKPGAPYGASSAKSRTTKTAQRNYGKSPRAEEAEMKLPSAGEAARWRQMERRHAARPRGKQQ